MADRPISDLIRATEILDDDLFLLQQGDYARALEGEKLKQYLERSKGVTNIEKISTVGLRDTYRITYSTTNTTFDFTVDNGRSITDVSLLGTSALVDTYRISFNDNTHVDYTVTNAKSITSVSKASTSGIVDTYNVNYNDGSPDTFTVTNAKSITSVTKGTTSGTTDTYDINYNTGDTPDHFTVKNAKSITNIAYASSAGKVDTYNVNYNEGASDQFTVTNGQDLAVVSILIEYGISTGASIQPSTWSTTFPTLIKGAFLWQRTTTTYSDGTYGVGISKTYMGHDGNPFIHVACGVITSLPVTVTDANITSDMVVASYNWDKTVIHSDLIIETFDGSLQIRGYINSTAQQTQPSLDLYLGRCDQEVT